ncbi:ATP-binding cassette sub-family A member 13-like [Lepisosteus oculatus]|uniref:ATP-binding cassette sub-family A member 13-like n=1 Tax=Lepisosteus oculatus TaxID=7918 RepID=UPI0035F51D4B
MLYSLPHILTISGGDFLNTDLNTIKQCILDFQRFFLFMEDLGVLNPSYSFFQTIHAVLNSSVSSLNTFIKWNNSGDEYGVLLWNIVWDPVFIQEQLEVRFGLDSQSIQQPLNVSVPWKKVLIEEELARAVCSTVSRVCENKSSSMAETSL